MILKPGFTGFLNTRLLISFGIALTMMTILFTTTSFKKDIDGKLESKQVNLLIRWIGHRLLLQAGDSTSRILPVTEIEKGNFLLRFENEFVFSHDSLMALAQASFPKNELPSGYTVTVHDCAKADIVYGFQINNTKSNITACNGRSQPKGCYSIEFSFPDFYKANKQAIIGTDQSIESYEGDEANKKPNEFKSTAFEYDTNQLAEGFKSSIVDAQKAHPKPEKFRPSTFNSVIYGSMLLMLGITFLIGRSVPVSKAAPAENESSALAEESVPEMDALGKFLFDAKSQRLLLGKDVIQLTDKEYKVLELLNKSFGELIARDTLMQEVWINEGVITGRSLDMFISKLRKKLSADPELRITNVHGKGYRLEIINEFLA